MASERVDFSSSAAIPPILQHQVPGEKQGFSYFYILKTVTSRLHVMSGHYQPTREMPLKWHPSGGPMDSGPFICLLEF